MRRWGSCWTLFDCCQSRLGGVDGGFRVQWMRTAVARVVGRFYEHARFPELEIRIASDTDTVQVQTPVEGQTCSEI